MRIAKAVVCVLMAHLVLGCLSAEEASAQVLDDFLERNSSSAKIAATEYMERITNLEPGLAQAVTATMATILQIEREQKHQALMSAGVMSERLHFAILVAEADELAILTDELQWDGALNCHRTERAAFRAAFLGKEYKQPTCRKQVYSALMSLPTETLSRMKEPDIREIFIGMTLVIEQRGTSIEFSARPVEKPN